MMVIIGILVMLFKFFLVLLAAIFVMLLLILLIPFEYSISALLKEKANFYLQVQWALFRFEILLEDLKPSIKISVFQRMIVNRPVEKKIRKKPLKKAGKSKFKMPGTSFFKEILSFLKEGFNISKPKEITAFGSFGLDDPSNTAVVSFIIMLVSEFAPWAQIGLNPIFDSEMTDVQINISGRIVLIVLVCIILKYIFKKEIRKVLFQKRTNTDT
jgi:hypothetical protein